MDPLGEKRSIPKKLVDLFIGGFDKAININTKRWREESYRQEKEERRSRLHQLLGVVPVSKQNQQRQERNTGEYSCAVKRGKSEQHRQSEGTHRDQKDRGSLARKAQRRYEKPW